MFFSEIAHEQFSSALKSRLIKSREIFRTTLCVYSREQERDGFHLVRSARTCERLRDVFSSIDFHWLSLQDKRMSVMDALVHPYIDEGRLRYHSCMCKCCFTVPLTGLRHFCMDYEPVAPQTFDDKWEKKMSNVQQVKGTVLLLHVVRACVSTFAIRFRLSKRLRHYEDVRLPPLNYKHSRSHSFCF